MEEFTQEMASCLMKLETKDQQFRGTFLYWAANIDRYLTGMIAWHFFPDDIYKRKMLVGHIISDINLDKKIRIFFNLVNTYHKEIINNHPKLSDHFKKIRELRNKLAHARLDTSLDYLRTKSTNIRLEIWKGDQLQFEEFTDEQIKQRISDVYKLHDELIKIMSELTGEKESKIVDIQFDSDRQEKSL